MESLQVKCSGVSPLLMHNSRLADPFDPFTVAIKALTSKKGKTEEDAKMKYWLEWLGGMYSDKSIMPSDAAKMVACPVIPESNILSFINDGARHFKRGPDVWRGCSIVGGAAKLGCGWPEKKTLEQAYALGTFNDVRSVVVQSSRIMRSRPIFRDWSFEFTLSYDPEIIDRKDAISFVEQAGRYNGICDGKPLYGRCAVTVK